MMTTRQRFHETMRYGQPDRVPWLEEGLRDDVLKQWFHQGFSREADLGEMFRYDRRERIELDLEPAAESNGFVLKRHDLPALRRDLDPNNPQRFPTDWVPRVKRWHARDHLLELPIHRGLFLTLGAHDWASLEQVLYLLAEDPTLVREVMDIHAVFAARLAERVLGEVEVDFASFSEPIGGNSGPLVSPTVYRQIVLDSYRPVLDALQQNGVDTIVFITYANARLLLDDVLTAGFNCLWAMETETEAMDYLVLRRRYGKSLRLIGGIDLDCLTRDEAAIEHEVMTRVPPLLTEGGYVPLADGRVRSNMPFHNYVYYRRLLQRVTATHHR